MKDEIKEIKDNLKINEYLDLIKEDKNLSMGYVSLAQYIYKLENKITNLQEENKKLDKIMKYCTSNIQIYDDGDGQYQGEDCCVDGFEIINIIEGGNNER